MTDFDLNAAIRAIVDDGDVNDPREISVLVDVPEEHLRSVLLELLPNRVRMVLRAQRRNAFGFGSGYGYSSPSSDSPAPRGETSKPAGPSRWARFTPELLASRVAVDGEWKELGDCTADDLDAIADDYAMRAAKNQAYEERFRDLARRLRNSTARVLRDVAESDEILRVAA